jgi:hypothetical protein
MEGTRRQPMFLMDFIIIIIITAASIITLMIRDSLHL